MKITIKILRLFNFMIKMKPLQLSLIGERRVAQFNGTDKTDWKPTCIHTVNWFWQTCQVISMRKE